MEAGYRDAIHVPFIMVSCKTVLAPGDKVSLRDDNKCVKWGGKPSQGEEWQVEPMKCNA